MYLLISYDFLECFMYIILILKYRWRNRTLTIIFTF